MKKKINSRQRSMQRKQQKAEEARKNAQAVIKIREEKRLQEKLSRFQDDILTFEKEIYLNAKGQYENSVPIYKVYMLADEDSVCENFYDKHAEKISIEAVFKLIVALYEACSHTQKKILLYEKGKLEVPKMDGDVSLEIFVDANDNVVTAGNIGENPLDLADISDSLRDAFRNIYHMRCSELDGQLDKVMKAADSIDINLGDTTATEQVAGTLR
ncbi:MAG: hypothetical protein AB8G05_09650 [Oligoflexales bacterium]